MFATPLHTTPLQHSTTILQDIRMRYHTHRNIQISQGSFVVMHRVFSWCALQINTHLLTRAVVHWVYIEAPGLRNAESLNRFLRNQPQENTLV